MGGLYWGMKPQRDFIDELEQPEWARLEFEKAPLVDRRLNARLSTIVSDFARHPGASVAEASETDAKTLGAYRFFENDDVDPQHILAGHRQASLKRLAQEPVVLAVSDTTTFNFAHLSDMEDMGPIGPKKDGSSAQGLLMHSTLAFTPKGLPLSLLAAHFWARSWEDQGPRIPEKLPFEQKESLRWRESWEACQAVRVRLPASTLVVNVNDREADIYEVFAAALAKAQPRAELLVRCCQNRKVVDEDSLLWELLAREPMVGTLQVRVPRKEKCPTRLATLQIRFREVLLQAPRNRGPQPALRVWAIEAREARPPKVGEPLLWRLLSTVPVTNAAEAIEKVSWYAVRWGIEIFHKIVKSVCRAEESQLETEERIERRLAVNLIVAWRIAVLTQVGRQNPDLPASDYFAEGEWKALSSYIHRQAGVPDQVPGLGQVMQWIGRLGGFRPSKAHPHPGPITLARGLRRLSDLAAMWAIQNTPLKNSSERCDK